MVGAKFLPGEICVLHLVGGIGVELRMEAARQRIPGGWQDHTGPLAARAQLAPDQPPPTGGPKGFAVSFLVRMLFSCLVDADFIATERFYARATGTPVARGGHRALSDLRDRLRTFMAETRAGAAPTPLNALRADILAHALDKAALSPGLFSLTVPTGGGKTLASLSFALEHAVRHGLKRIIYVFPTPPSSNRPQTSFRRPSAPQMTFWSTMPASIGRRRAARARPMTRRRTRSPSCGGRQSSPVVPPHGE
ncbi:hypothetical protein [Xanthobacter sp. ZOL 2024]